MLITDNKHPGGMVTRYLIISVLLMVPVLSDTLSYTEKYEMIKPYLISQALDRVSHDFFLKQIEDSRYYDHKDLPDSVWDVVVEELDEKEAFMRAIGEFYIQRLTDEELRELHRMFTSPVYSKVDFLSSGNLEKEFGMIAVKLGRNMGGKITAFLIEKGFISQ